MSDKPTTQESLKDFLSEAEEILESLNLDLVRLVDDIESSQMDPDLVNGIFRNAHSLKGLSGMFGFDDIGRVSHSLESLLDGLRLGKIPLEQKVIDTLFHSLDILTKLVEGKSNNVQFSMDIVPLLDLIQDAIQCSDQKTDDPLSSLDIDPAIRNVLTEYEEHRLRENVTAGRLIQCLRQDFDLASFDQGLAEVTQGLKQQGEVISTLPSAGDAGDRIAFQILFASDLTKTDLEKLLGQEDLEIKVFQSSLNEKKEHRKTSSETAGSSRSEPPGSAQMQELPHEPEQGNSLRSISRTVRVDIDKLDALMNIVGELVLSKGSIDLISQQLKMSELKEIATDLDKAVHVLDRRLNELQKAVLDVRMVPVGQLFEKMTRIVRRVANEQGKKVDLDISGTETELDKLIIEDITDPLMHIIRNAIDHGLETPAERRQSGKLEKGLIQLAATQKGNHVVLEVKDDGRGIDSDNVRHKALSMGLIAENQELSEAQLFDLLLMPGFSTRNEVSDLSGRGVGMDVVKNNISALSGLLEIQSKPGLGTSVAMTLPITLAIIKALIVQVSTSTYAIPINSVMETLIVDEESIQTVEKREVIEIRNTTVPLLRLEDWFGLPKTAKGSGRRQFVAIVGLADKRMGLVVDDLLGQQDVVIKPLGQVLAFVKGIAGAADLGNQKTILVLDVAGMLSEALRGDVSSHV